MRASDSSPRPVEVAAAPAGGSLSSTFVRYLVFGGAAALLDLLLFLEFLASGMALLPAASAAFALAVTANYLLCSWFVYAAPLAGRRFTFFVLTALVALVLNAGTTAATAFGFAAPVALAKVIGIGVAFLVNFIVNTFWVFGQAERPGKRFRAGAPAGRDRAAKIAGAPLRTRPTRFLGLAGYRGVVTRAVVATVWEMLGIPPDPLAAQATARFLVDEADAMPHALGPGMAILTLVFDLSAVARTGRPFHRLSAEARRRHLLAWRRSRLDAFRSFVKFHETFTAFHRFATQPSGTAHDG